MKWKLAWKQINNSRLMTIFITIELFLFFILMIAGSSIISYNTKNYREFSDYFSHDGYYVDLLGSPAIDSPKLEEKLKDVQVTSCYYGTFEIKEKENTLVLGYDTDFVKRHKPELVKGEWLTKASKKENVLHVVVGGTLRNMEPGTILHGMKMNSDQSFDIKVIGVLNDHATIIGHPNGSRQTNSDYNKMYTKLDSVDVKGGLMLFSKEEMERLNQLNKVQMDYSMGDICFIRYNKGISREDNKYNNDYITNRITYNERIALPQMKKESLRKMGVKFYSLIPILGAIFCMTLITAICNNAIMIRRQSYSYAVYYICGMKWRDCIKVNIITNLIQTVIAFWGAAIIVRLFIVGRYYLTTAITFTMQEVIVCIVAEIIYLFLALLLPYFMISGSNPCKVLNDNMYE